MTMLSLRTVLVRGDAEYLGELLPLDVPPRVLLRTLELKDVGITVTPAKKPTEGQE